MNAANFMTFSTGIGTYGSVNANKYLHDFPKEYGRMCGQGLLARLPKQKADEKLERPAYVTDVRFQMAAGIIINSMCPKLREKDAVCGPYKHELYHRAHPKKKFLEVCRQDWHLQRRRGCVRLTREFRWPMHGRPRTGGLCRGSAP